MKKFIILFITALLSTISLLAKPKAVVFDFGGVMTDKQKKEVAIQYLRSTFSLSEDDFKKVNFEKKQAVKAGKSEEEFWLEFAVNKGVFLCASWIQEFKTMMNETITVNPDMYVLVAELKAKKIRVGLLSNVSTRRANLVREFGLYEPFDPCLLSCEIGVEKPNQKAYALLLERLNLPAGHIVFIDNKQQNVENASKVGLDAILFQSETQLRQELLMRKLL